MAIVDMNYAERGEPASSAEYNKVVDNIRDVDSRLNAVSGDLSHLSSVVGSGVFTETDTISSWATQAQAAVEELIVNQGVRGSHGPIYDEIAALKAGGGDGDGAPPPTSPDDTTLYGDIISSHDRASCPHGETLGNGYMTAVATVSTKTFTAKELRIAVGQAAVNGGTFDLKFYTGNSLSSLQEQEFFYGASLINTTGVKKLALPDIPISAGQYVAICMIVTGWETVPRLASTLPVGTSGAQVWLNEVPYSVWEAGRTYPPPSTLDMYGSNWTRANQLFWFALA